MNKVYQRINWNTDCCNGFMDPDKYLHTQIARAICQAAYEEPLTVEEISIRTGIPAMYIEDELIRLEYGDAISKIGKNKYVTNFIIFRLEDRKSAEGVSEPIVKMIAENLDTRFRNTENTVQQLDFYGNDFGMDRLGYFLVPYILRQKIQTLKSKQLNLGDGPFPPRKDGGYGWFVVEETVDENEVSFEYNTGCNIAVDGHGEKSHIYYYWISKYFINDIYHNGGTRWLCANHIPHDSAGGIIEKGVIPDEDLARLIQNNLVVKENNVYKLNFACFTEAQFTKFISLFDMEDESLDDLLAKWIVTVRKRFEKFVPSRLDDQINQWISCYLFQIVGYVTDELICRGTLKMPTPDKPLTDGVFYVEGKCLEP